GKRKSSKKPQAKVKVTLSKEFQCVLCNHESAVTVRMDKSNQIGNLQCKKCGVTFQSIINSLSEPIDVYHDWIDASEEVNKDIEARAGGGAAGGRRAVEDDLDDDDY
ncbi:transcription elongation factor Elf1 like-domain-containing protein, partial [Chytriomyces sp. MP71]